MWAERRRLGSMGLVGLSLLAARRHCCASVWQACPRVGHTPSAFVAQVQRVEIARLLVELAMQSALMRDTLQDEYAQRREQRRELHELRMKFKRCGSAAGPSGCRTALARAEPVLCLPGLQLATPCHGGKPPTLRMNFSENTSVVWVLRSLKASDNIFRSAPHMQPLSPMTGLAACREHQEQVEREKALKEAKAHAEGTGAQDRASMHVVKELLKEEGKRCAPLPQTVSYIVLTPHQDAQDKGPRTSLQSGVDAS